MEPRIQYAQTKDGVSIAYWTLGEGMPLVVLPSNPITSTQSARQMPDVRRWYDRMAEGRMLVRYDPRGAGLSDREVADLSLDGRLLDLEAVVDCLGLEQFAVFAYSLAGSQAIAYAARHPERVTHLLLWCTSARASEAMDRARLNALLGLADLDWQLFTETLASDLLGWSAGEEARRMAAYLRENATPELLRAGLDAMLRVDVTDLLPLVKSPTLVMHRRRLHTPGLDVARRLASRIPRARLAVLEGEVMWPFSGDTEAMLSVIAEFLGEGEEAALGAEAPEAGAFRTVLFTDVEGSTALTQRLGDARAREVLREHERMVREALKSHAGSELKTIGDGFMAAFSSATRALESAIAMQRAFAAHNEAAAARPSTGSGRAEVIRVRIGLNAGEPIAEEDDLYGTAVNLAARICGHAEAGQILASDVVRQLVAGKDFLFADRGEVALRGFDEPVRLYEVRWQEEG